MDTNLNKGSISIKSIQPLVKGNYKATITASDLAGNIAKKITNFTIDDTVDTDAPTFVQQFPPPGAEIPIQNFNAIEFQTLDADQTDFDEMAAEINGVTYHDLFSSSQSESAPTSAPTSATKPEFKQTFPVNGTKHNKL